MEFQALNFHFEKFVELGTCRMCEGVLGLSDRVNYSCKLKNIYCHWMINNRKRRGKYLLG